MLSPKTTACALFHVLVYYLMQEIMGDNETVAKYCKKNREKAWKLLSAGLYRNAIINF